MKQRVGTSFPGDSMGILFACSLGAILFSVTGHFFFVLLAGASAAAGIKLGRLIQRFRRRQL